jgi:regulatory protein
MKITAIKRQVKRSERYSIFVDGKYAFSLGEAALIEQRLATGQELEPAQLKGLKAAAGFDKAYTQTLRYIAIRPRSEGELADYYRRKGIDEAAAQEITRRLRDMGLVNDRAFAEAWVANRRLLKNVSKRRLILELKQKNIDPEVIHEVLEENPTDDRQALRQLAVKKRARYPDTQRLLQYLARQGFGYDDIKAVLAEESEP